MSCVYKMKGMQIFTWKLPCAYILKHYNIRYIFKKQRVTNIGIYSSIRSQKLLKLFGQPEIKNFNTINYTQLINKIHIVRDIFNSNGFLFRIIIKNNNIIRN